MKVRVLTTDFKEIILDNLSSSEAEDRFLFYVHAAVELKCSIRAVNIIKGNKSIKLFQNR